MGTHGSDAHQSQGWVVHEWTGNKGEVQGSAWDHLAHRHLVVDHHDHVVLQPGEAQRPGGEVGGPLAVEDGSASSSVHAPVRRAEKYASVYDESNRRVGHPGVVWSVWMDWYSLCIPSGDSGHPLQAAGSDPGSPARLTSWGVFCEGSGGQAAVNEETLHEAAGAENSVFLALKTIRNRLMELFWSQFRQPSVP